MTRVQECMRDLSPADLARLADYFAHELPPDQGFLVEQWIAQDPALHAAILDLKHVRASQLENARTPSSQVDALVQAVMTEAGIVSPAIGQAARVRKQSGAISRGRLPGLFGRWTLPKDATFGKHTLGWGAIGAALIVLLAFVVQRPDHGISEQYTTAVGERRVVTLNDGSRITLAPQTTLRVTERRGWQPGRSIALNGRALFDVATVSRSPFVVTTGAVETRVLGTTFSIQYDAPATSVVVAVRSGKVAVGRTGRKSITVAAGEVVHLQDSTVFVSRGETPAQYTEWARGELQFDNTPLPEVLTTLSRWYGYDFRIADSSLVHRTVTVKFPERSLAQALGTLKVLLNLELQYDRRTVIVRSASQRHSPRDRSRVPTFSPNSEVGR
jgi:ferric-dicitrate binding protein FerR (iron transport regulator)